MLEKRAQAVAQYSDLSVAGIATKRGEPSRALPHSQNQVYKDRDADLSEIVGNSPRRTSLVCSWRPEEQAEVLAQFPEPCQ
jgi:hypothetical protein